MSEQIRDVKGCVKIQADRLNRVSLNLDTLYDRLCSETTKTYKSQNKENDDDDKNVGDDNNDEDDEQDDDSDV